LSSYLLIFALKVKLKGALNSNFLNLTMRKILILKTFWSYFLTCFC